MNLVVVTIETHNAFQFGDGYKCHLSHGDEGCTLRTAPSLLHIEQYFVLLVGDDVLSDQSANSNSYYHKVDESFETSR